MKMGLESKSEIGFRGIFPFISTLVLVIITQIQYKVFFLDNLFPFLSLTAVYYWCIFKPRLMPVSAVFFLGLLQDILSGNPLGMMAFLLLVVRAFVVGQGGRFLDREFLYNWLVFIIVALVFGLATWVVASIYLKDTQNFWNAFGQSMMTIAIFPGVVLGLGWVRSLLVTDNR